MLPDFPQTKRIFGKRLRRSIREIMRSQGILAVIQEKPIHEGNLTSVKQKGKATKVQSPWTLTQKLAIDKQRLITEGPAYIAESFFRASAKARSDAAKMVYQHIDSSSKEDGTAFDAGGKPLNFEMYMDMVSRLDIVFDETGNPLLPTLATSSHKILQQWNKDPASIARLEELMEEKRKAWRDRESNRKLVD